MTENEILVLRQVLADLSPIVGEVDRLWENHVGEGGKVEKWRSGVLDYVHNEIVNVELSIENLLDNLENDL